MYLKIKFLAMVATATFLAKVFILIGKLAIITGNIFLFKLALLKLTKEDEAVSSPVGPMVVVGCISYLFVSLFIGLFDETVNAMLTSVAVDTNCNGQPIFGPETFNDRL